MSVPSTVKRYIKQYLENNASGDDASFNSLNAPVSGPTYLVASDEADQKTKDIADYVCNGINDHETIQQAIDDTEGFTTGAGRVILSEGRFDIDGKIEIDDSNNGIWLCGSGKRATEIRCTTGGTRIDILRLFGARDVTVSNMMLRGNPTNPVDRAVVLETKSGATITQNTFKNILVTGTNSGGMNRAFEMVNGTGGDNNNSEHSFFDVTVKNFDERAWSINHSQSKQHFFFACVGAQSAGSGDYIVHSSGSYSWFGGNVGSVNTASFYQASPNDVINIKGALLEADNAELFFDTAGPTGGEQSVSITGCTMRWQDTPSSGWFIRSKQGGPMEISGCDIEDNSGSIGSAQIQIQSAGSEAEASIRDTYIKTGATVPFDGLIEVGDGVTVDDGNTKSKFNPIDQSGYAYNVSGLQLEFNYYGKNQFTLAANAGQTKTIRAAYVGAPGGTNTGHVKDGMVMTIINGDGNTYTLEHNNSNEDNPLLNQSGANDTLDAAGEMAVYRFESNTPAWRQVGLNQQ